MSTLFTAIALPLPVITLLFFTAYALGSVFKYEFRSMRAAYITSAVLGVICGALIDVIRIFMADRITVADIPWDELILMSGTVIHAIVMMIMLRGKVWRRILAVIMTADIINNIDSIFGDLRQQFFGIGDWSGNVRAWVIYIVFIFLEIVMEFIFFAAIAHIRSKHDNTPLPLPFIGIIMVVLQLFNGVVVEDADDAATGPDYSIIKIVTLLLALIVLLMLFYIRVTRKERDGLRDVNKVHEELIESQTRYFVSSAKADSEIRAMRHDMKNNIQVLMLLLEKGEYDKMHEYLEEMGEGLTSADISAHTGDTIADAIIADKTALASSRGLTLKCSGKISGIEISPVDMCKILANLLDNAIEAASSDDLSVLDDSLKVIDLQFRKTENFFMISVTNPSGTEPLIEDGRIVTSKTDRKKHGFGIRNIEAAAASYGGSPSVSSEATSYGYQFRAEVVFMVET